jgi:hypothetical protein
MSTSTSGTVVATGRRPSAHHLARLVAWIALAVTAVAVATTVLVTHRASSNSPAPRATVSAPAPRAADESRRLVQINSTGDDDAAQPPSGHTLRTN